MGAVTTATFAAIADSLAAGDGVGALKLADIALADPSLTDPDRSRLLVNRAIALHGEGDQEGALADLTRAMEAHNLTNPEQARAYLERGLVLDSMGKLPLAVGDYTAVLRLEPGSAQALNNRANAYRRQNRMQEARADYLASLAASNPAPEYPYYGLGQISESENNMVEAKNFYSRAVAANPGYSLAADRLAILGGAPPPAAAPIILKPPISKSGSGGMTLAADAPVVLRPPSPKGEKSAMAKAAPAVSSITRPVGQKPAKARDVVTLRPGFDRSVAAPKAGGTREVQLGAWRQVDEAAAGWTRALKQADGVLDGHEHRLVAVNLPGRGRFYRLRVSTDDVAGLCAALRDKGLDCIAVRE